MKYLLNKHVELVDELDPSVYTSMNYISVHFDKYCNDYPRVILNVRDTFWNSLGMDTWEKNWLTNYFSLGS